MGNQDQDSIGGPENSVVPMYTIDYVLQFPSLALAEVRRIFLSDDTNKDSHETPEKPSPQKELPTPFQSFVNKIDLVRQLAWNNTSPKQLERAETRLFQSLTSPYQQSYVPVAQGSNKIWTVSFNVTSKNTPLVLLHGFAGGIGVWCLNYDSLCADRPVYAIDLPGFGRSSRPTFSTDPRIVEKQLVDLLEEWRIAVGLDRDFVLLGHSFGGFLCAAYALAYPKYVKQLVLADPWGFSHKPENIWEEGRFQSIPIWLRPLSPLFLKMSPLTGLRAVGPLGVTVIKIYRSELCERFRRALHDDRAMIYLYHCNARYPSGEAAFQALSDCFAWAKDPMIDRIHLLESRIPIHFIHGEDSWLPIEPSLTIEKQRENVAVIKIKDAGHQLFADQPEEFAARVKEILPNN